METFYIFVVVVLFILAVSDLVVGVSNDAVNFLNSAIGSKAASFRVIMLIASMGVLIGATFSGGMMEVARKGVMHPEQFFFAEIMLIFLAVMMTDIILLDFYNTFGLPTSTTVSIVFELLGASVAIATIKILNLGQSIGEMGTYINSAKALAIIAGILISVVVAFASGALVQYLTRILFSYNLAKTYRRYGGIFGGLALSFILYFMLIKGAKGATFMSDQNIQWIVDHTWLMLLINFVGWTAILQLLIWFTKVNILKIIVLAGTFSLAMAFAANDLVNFIGVPLAGLESLKSWLADGGGDPNGMLMGVLQGPVKTPTLFLLIAGLVMVGTLYLSRKARSVTKTTIDLSRQDAGSERFEATAFSRAIVRHSRNVNKATQNILPKRLLGAIEKRFDRSGISKKDQTSFDLIRASINLLVAAVLIAFGTSLKLPLSTTYVTFMVAMGTSLADRAWGRDSAVYRITGVVVVIAGWFVTAFLAFVSSFIMAYLLHYGGLVAIFGLISLAIFLIIRSKLIHRRREKKELKEDAENAEGDKELTEMERRTKQIFDIIRQYDDLYRNIIIGLGEEKRKKLMKVNSQLADLNAEIKKMKLKIPQTIRSISEDHLESGHYYIQLLDYLSETAYNLTFIARPALEHVQNNHQELNKIQYENLGALSNEISRLLGKVIDYATHLKPESMKDISNLQDQTVALIDQIEARHLKRIKTEQISTRNSVLYIGILRETRNFVLFMNNLARAYQNTIQPS